MLGFAAAAPTATITAEGPPKKIDGPPRTFVLRLPALLPLVVLRLPALLSLVVKLFFP
jgi:hypothetical protein